jgi:hypothetical protein
MYPTKFRLLSSVSGVAILAASMSMLATSAAACPVNLNADTTVTTSGSCNYVLQSGNLTIDADIDNTGFFSAIQVLTTAPGSTVTINAGASVAETTTLGFHRTGIQIGDGNPGTYLSVLDNYGLIENTTYQPIDLVIHNRYDATLGTFYNREGAIVRDTTFGQYGFMNEGTIDLLHNAGTMVGYVSIITNEGGTINNLVNDVTGVIESTDVGEAINNNGTIGTFVNRGLVTAYDYGLANYGSIATLVNLGTFAHIGSYASDIANWGGTIGALHNYQGVNGSGGTVLKFGGYGTDLPGTYYVVISGSNYGQMFVDSDTGPVSGSMAFGISSYSGRIRQSTYEAVISNLDASYFAGLTGTYEYREGQFVDWELVETAPNSGIWDLVFLSTPVYPPLADQTLLALAASRDAVRAKLSQRSAEMANALDYDCNNFGANGTCLGFQARYMDISGESEAAGVITLGQRIAPQVRVGGFIDIRGNEKDPRGIETSNDTPSFGGFIGFGGNADGTGLQARVSAGYNNSDATITRSLFGEVGDTEPGKGTSELRSFGVGGQIGWGTAYGGAVLAPYIGLRHIEATRGGYTERTEEDVVAFPITYAGYGQSSTAAILGLRINGELMPRVGYQLSIGGEYDLARSGSRYAFSSEIEDLEAGSLAHGGSTERARAFGSLGLHYQIDANQRLTGSFGARQEGFSSDPSLTTMVGYQVSF